LTTQQARLLPHENEKSASPTAKRSLLASNKRSGIFSGQASFYNSMK
jgi:hypothetical protein